MDLMGAKEEHIVQAALDQVEGILRDLEKHSSQGYVLGYELGYMKGVLEHVLKTCPQSAHDRDVYIKGFVRGYAQGILYTVQRKEMGEPAMNMLEKTNNLLCTKGGQHPTDISVRKEHNHKKGNRLEVHGTKCGNEDCMRRSIHDY